MGYGNTWDLVSAGEQGDESPVAEQGGPAPTFEADFFGPKNSGLPGAFFTDLLCDRAGRLWVGTMNGPAIYEEGDFRSFYSELVTAAQSQSSETEKKAFRRAGKVADMFLRRESLPGPERILSVPAIQGDSEGGVWVATELALFRFDGCDWHEVEDVYEMTAGHVSAMCRGPGGSIVIGTSRGGLAVRRTDRWEILRREPLPQQEISNPCLVMDRYIASDGEERLWMIDSYHEEFRGYKFSEEQWRKLGLPTSIRHLWRGIVHCDRRTQTLYLGAGSGATRTGTPVLVAAKKDAARTEYRPDFSGAGWHEIGCVYVDSCGRVWVGTSAGLGLVQGQVYSRVPLPSDEETDSRKTVRAITEDNDGHIWAGTDKGLWKLTVSGDPETIVESARRLAQARAETKAPEPRIKWKRRVSQQMMLASPALGPDGSVYVGSLDGSLYSLSPDGEVNWRRECGPLSSSAAVDASGTVYAGSSDGFLYAVSAQGQVKWKVKIGAEVWTSPCIGPDGTVYVRPKDRYLYAISPSGTVRWRAKTGVPMGTSPAVSAEGTVYVGSRDGFLYAVSSTGEIRWKTETGGQVWNQPCPGSDGTVYVRSRDGYLYAISPVGEVKWKMETGVGKSYSPPVEYQETVFVASEGYLSAITDEGDVLWRQHMEGLSAPAVGADGVLYVGAIDHMYAISPAGTVRWKVRTSPSVFGQPAVGHDRTIYAGCFDGTVLAIAQE